MGSSLAGDSLTSWGKVSSLVLVDNQEGERCDNDKPDAEESKTFLGDIWSELVDHNRYVKWLKDLQSEVKFTKQEKVDITKESLKKILGRTPNWKSSVPDLDRGF